MKKRSNRRPKHIRELDTKVQQLQRYLLNFYRTKIKKLANTQGIPIQFFQQKYEKELQIHLTVFVQDIYLSRVKSLETAILKNRRSKSAGLLEMFASFLDLVNIKKVVKKVSDRFFASVDRLITRDATKVLDLEEGTLKAKKSYDAVAAMNRVAASAGYTAYNLATASKLNEISTAGLDDTGLDIIDGANFQLEYVTAQDDLVCDICEPLDGQIFDVDDPELPDLPEHDNCRCYLEEIIGAPEVG